MPVPKLSKPELKPLKSPLGLPAMGPVRPTLKKPEPRPSSAEPPTDWQLCFRRGAQLAEQALG
jgi:hypothetical protein